MEYIKNKPSYNAAPLIYVLLMVVVFAAATIL
jgi:hypothetical protein